MKIILETYYILLPIVATALVGWVGLLLKGQKKEKNELTRRQEAQSRGIMVILRYMLQRYHGEYRLQKQITYNQYKNWKDIYQIYTDLGGNSIAEEWNEDIEQMDKCESTQEMSIYEAFLQNRNEN